VPHFPVPHFPPLISSSLHRGPPITSCASMIHRHRFSVSATPTCFPLKFSGPPHSSPPPWATGRVGACRWSPRLLPTVGRHSPIPAHRLIDDPPHGWVLVPPLLPRAFSLVPSCPCRRPWAAGASVAPRHLSYPRCGDCPRCVLAMRTAAWAGRAIMAFGPFRSFWAHLYIRIDQIFICALLHYIRFQECKT
jgi:hypothetical protein